MRTSAGSYARAIETNCRIIRKEDLERTSPLTRPLDIVALTVLNLFVKRGEITPDFFFFWWGVTRMPGRPRSLGVEERTNQQSKHEMCTDGRRKNVYALTEEHL
jgi:hypothetical protein